MTHILLNARGENDFLYDAFLSTYRCGANWQSDGQAGNSVLVQFIEPRGISFYRLHPNYFFHAGDNRRLRIHGAGFSTITVCHSRNVERPRFVLEITFSAGLIEIKEQLSHRSNVTSSERPQGEVNCQNVNSDTVEINLSNACEGHGKINGG